MNKTILATTIAALMSASALPALAQDAAVGVDAGAGVNGETPAGDAGADATVGADANASTNAMSTAADAADHSYASVTAAISGSADVDLSAITDEAQVNIVLLSSLEGDAATEAAGIDSAIAANAEGAATLHDNIDGNAAIKAKLEAQGYAADDVVAVHSRADGSVTVYVDDRA